MERCPKCRGTLTTDWEQPSCINCGWVQYRIETTVRSHLNAVERDSKLKAPASRKAYREGRTCSCGYVAKTARGLTAHKRSHRRANAA